MIIANSLSILFILKKKKKHQPMVSLIYFYCFLGGVGVSIYFHSDLCYFLLSADLELCSFSNSFKW